jgi:membrane protein DedA with SNARE-associated domain
LLVGAESLGIPLPGETALILAGTYAGHTHRLSPWLIFLVAAAAAIIGDNIGYWIGDKGGYRLARRYGPKVRLDEHKLKIARYLFDRYGDRVVFFGRFVSVLRTYAAFLAGVSRMRWRRFLPSASPPYRPAPYRQVSRIEPSTLIPRSTLSTVADHLAERRVAHHPTEDTHSPTRA